MRFWRDRFVQVCAAVVAVALIIAVVWGASAGDEPVTDTAPAPTSTAGQAAPVALGDVDDLRDVVGRRIIVDDAEVESVPGDEGFWIAGPGSTWVQLVTAGESPFTVRAGEHVSFTGTVVAHGADFADRPEFSQLDANRLVDAGAHIEVPVGDVKLSG